MGRYYPVDWLCSLIDVLREIGGFDVHIAWLERKYLRPNIDKTLFAVTDYRPWLLCMKSSLVLIQKEYPKGYDILLHEDQRVTKDVFRIAELADQYGNYAVAQIFTDTYDRANFARVFEKRDFSHIYDTFVDRKNEIDWVHQVQYPIYIAWRVCAPKTSAGVSFDNFLFIQRYLHNEIMEILTTDKRVIAKALGKNVNFQGGYGMHTNAYADAPIEDIKPVASAPADEAKDTLEKGTTSDDISPASSPDSYSKSDVFAELFTTANVSSAELLPATSYSTSAEILSTLSNLFLQSE